MATVKNQLPTPCEVVTALTFAWFGVGREALGLWAELLKGAKRP